jgi:hypothetical protein
MLWRLLVIQAPYAANACLSVPTVGNTGSYYSGCSPPVRVLQLLLLRYVHTFDLIALQAARLLLLLKPWMSFPCINKMF